MIVSRRVPPQGDIALQNARQSSAPTAPTIIKMTATVLMLTPRVFTLTANARMAPIANRKMLTPMPTARPPFGCFTFTRGRCSLTGAPGGRRSRAGLAQLPRDRLQISDECDTLGAARLVVGRSQDRRRVDRRR